MNYILYLLAIIGAWNLVNVISRVAYRDFSTFKWRMVIPILLGIASVAAIVWKH